MTKIQKTVFILVALVALVMGLTFNKMMSGKNQGDNTSLIDAGIILLPQSRQLPNVTMTNQDGQPVVMNELKGKWSMLFFGYTFCPDICPTTLAQLRQIKSELPKEVQDKLQIVLVSVDPHRDTPQQLKQYLGYFDPQFVGLTPGSIDELQTLANAVSIPFIPADTSKANYTVDHSGNLALIGPDGTQRGFIRAPFNNQKMVAQLPGLVERKSGKGCSLLCGLACDAGDTVFQKNRTDAIASKPAPTEGRVCSDSRYQNAGTMAPLYFSRMNAFTSGLCRAATSFCMSAESLSSGRATGYSRKASRCLR